MTQALFRANAGQKKCTANVMYEIGHIPASKGDSLLLIQDFSTPYGSHVANMPETGAMAVTRIGKKSAATHRVVPDFAG